jgi:hypothetical protein
MRPFAKKIEGRGIKLDGTPTSLALMHIFIHRLYLVWFLSVGLLLLPLEVCGKDICDDGEFFHLVSPGESLNRIASRYLPRTEAVTVGELIEKIRTLNSIQESLIRPNQRLLIPLAPSAPLLAKTVPKERDFEARGIYLNRFSMGCKKMGRLVDKLIYHGGNAVIVDAKDMSGRLCYPSRVSLAKEISASTRSIIHDPSRLFHYLHKRGLHAIVRIVLFYDPLLAAKRPDLALRCKSTGEPCREKGRIAWVDPRQPAVQRYNLDIAKELAEMGADEIQFDYIRFPTVEDMHEAELDLEEQEIPRHKVITDFLAQAHRELLPYKVLLSIDVFGIVAWGRAEDIRITGQKIEDLVRHCDVISPMIYPSHFYGRFQGMANPGGQPFRLVWETCRRFSTLLEGLEVTLRPWIQAFPWGAENFSDGYILEQLCALDQSKSRGWLLWSAGNAYDAAWRACALWNERASNQITASVQRFGINSGDSMPRYDSKFRRHLPISVSVRSRPHTYLQVSYE